MYTPALLKPKLRIRLLGRERQVLNVFAVWGLLDESALYKFPEERSSLPLSDKQEGAAPTGWAARCGEGSARARGVSEQGFVPLSLCTPTRFCVMNPS